MDNITCPHCARAEGQLKIGRNASGSQRYFCTACRRKHTPKPEPIGYAQDVRQQALGLYVDGLNFRRIGRVLGLSHQTVANWVAAYARTLPDMPPAPAHDAHTPLAIGELDELYTFEGEKRSGSTSSPG